MVDRFQTRDVLIPYGIFLVIILVAFIAPPLAMFVGMFTPVPLILVYLQRGKMTGLVTITAVSLALLVLVGPQLAIAFIAAYGIMAAAMAETIRLSFSFEKIIGISALAPTVLTLLMLFIGLDGKSSMKALEDTIRTEAESYIQVLEKAGETPENLKDIRKSVKATVPIAAKVFPTFILISALVGAITNFLAIRYLWLRFYTRQYFEGVDVSRWMLPDVMVWVLIASVGSMFFGPEISQVAGMNLAIILLFLYFLQGLSVVTHILKAKAFPKWAWVLIFVLIPLNPMFFGLVVGMGLFDIWVDFRKIRVTPPPDSMNSME
ncbi:MAG TPA: DUF2232 domain-containing protein [Desulfobacteria bacterium]|nr:DUF2232 domain-containing protein [Desulfobacteria bacterium]